MTRRLAGVFCASCAVLLLELALTRIFSVVMWYHFASLAVAAALLGFAAGGVLVHLRPRWAPEGERGERRQGAVLLAFAASCLLPFALLGLARAKPDLLLPLLSFFHQPWYQPFRSAPPGPETGTVISLVVLLLLLLLPFLLAGWFFAALFFRARPEDTGRLYGADLAGAAAGAALTAPALSLLGAPSVLPLAASLAALASFLFAPRGRLRWGALVAVALLLALALVNGPGDRITRLPFARGQYEPELQFSGWNALSRVAVYPLTQSEAEQTWGLSRRYQGRVPAMKGMVVDDAGYAPIVAAGAGAPSPTSWAPAHVVSLGYLLRPGGSAFIIGPGGGRDILAAVGSGMERVVAVELNPLEVRAVQELFGGFSGRPYSMPRVETVVGEGRSEAARRSERFDVVAASSVFGEIAPAAGAFSLSANFLYTREAFDIFWDRLEDDGILSFSWSVFGHRVPRLAVLARETLLARGGGKPEQSIAVLRERGLATILIAKNGFTPGEVACLTGLAHRWGYTIDALPGRPAQTPVARAIAGEDISGGKRDLSPPTDDRPFFYQEVPPARFLSTLLSPAEPGERHVVVLRTLGGALLLLTGLLLFLPLLPRRGEPPLPRGGLLPAGLYFAGIGVGYMLVELTVMQRLVLFLGDPVLALAVILASLLLASGAGAHLSRPVGKRLGRFRGVVPVALVLLLLLTWKAAGALSPGLALPWAGKALLAALLLLPAGFLMGLFLPWGLAEVGRRDSRLVPWGWAVNGAASVLGSFLSLALAMAAGFTASLAAGAACYLLTLPFLAPQGPATGGKEVVG